MRTTETSWLRTTETLLGASFETYLRLSRDVLIRCFCYVLLRSCHEVPIKRHGDILFRRLGDVPPRRCWVFHLRRIYDVTGTYTETSLRRCNDNLLPDGSSFIFQTNRNILFPLTFVTFVIARTFFPKMANF